MSLYPTKETLTSSSGLLCLTLLMISFNVSFERSIQTCMELVQSISRHKSKIALDAVFFSDWVDFYFSSAGIVPFAIEAVFASFG